MRTSRRKRTRHRDKMYKSSASTAPPEIRLPSFTPAHVNIDVRSSVKINHNENGLYLSEADNYPSVDTQDFTGDVAPEKAALLQNASSVLSKLPTMPHKRPHFPAKPNLSERLEVNNNDVFGSGNEREGENWVCRHIATTYVNQKLRKPDLDDLFDRQLKSPQGLSKVGGTEEDYDSFLAKANHHIIDSRELGRWIVDMASELEAKGCRAGESTFQHAMILTGNHAMAMTVEVKGKGGGARYVVRFFDPNTTLEYTRAATNSLDDFKGYQLVDFLSEHRASLWFDHYDKATPSIIVVSTDLHGKPKSFESSFDDCEQWAHRLWHAMGVDAPAEIDQIAKLVGQTVAGRLSANQLKGLLQAKDIDGTPGLCLALQRGHGKAIEAYAKLVEQALKGGLPADQLKELLLAKDARGFSGLSVALRDGKGEAVEAYAKLVEQAVNGGVPSGQLKELLLAEDVLGVPGLYWALYNGHANVIEGYAKLVEQAVKGGGLPAALLKELLAAKDVFGDPALYAAMQNGHGKAIEAYARVVEEAVKGGLRADQLKELLLAKDTRGVTGLFVALCDGKDEAVEAHAKLMAQAVKGGLYADQLKELLLGKDINGLPGIYVALHKGHGKTIDAYAKVVEQAVNGGLPAEQLEELPLARNGRDVEALPSALKRDRDDLNADSRFMRDSKRPKK